MRAAAAIETYRRRRDATRRLRAALVVVAVGTPLAVVALGWIGFALSLVASSVAAALIRRTKSAAAADELDDAWHLPQTLGTWARQPKAARLLQAAADAATAGRELPPVRPMLRSALAAAGGLVAAGALTQVPTGDIGRLAARVTAAVDPDDATAWSDETIGSDVDQPAQQPLARATSATDAVTADFGSLDVESPGTATGDEAATSDANASPSRPVVAAAESASSPAIDGIGQGAEGESLVEPGTTGGDGTRSASAGPVARPTEEADDVLPRGLGRDYHDVARGYFVTAR
jgi:hypothetical protein